MHRSQGPSSLLQLLLLLILLFFPLLPSKPSPPTLVGRGPETMLTRTQSAACFSRKGCQEGLVMSALGTGTWWGGSRGQEKDWKLNKWWAETP